MALPYLRAADPDALALLAVRVVRNGIREQDMGVARLALGIGATAEHEAVGQPGDGWGTEAQVRVGLALIDCAMRATGWFALSAGPDLRLVLVVRASAMDAVRHRLGLEAHGAESFRPALRDLAPPFRTIRTLLGGLSVRLVLAEAVGDLSGGSVSPGRAVPMARA